MEGNMPQTRFLLALPVILWVLSVPALAQGTRTANETLLAATSPFEDMVEFALAGNDSGITRALVAADRASGGVKDALSAGAASRFGDLLQAIHEAASGREYQVLALTAVDVFRLLLDGLQPEKLKVPKEVSLLDYAGFKLNVLADAVEPDWDAMRETAKDASVWWKAVEPRVSETALRDAFSSTVSGLREATKNENLPMLRFAVQMDLDLVDLLENHFSRQK
jgi:hypothetical protein